jgi:HK97 family phage major capsid protein
MSKRRLRDVGSLPEQFRCYEMSIEKRAPAEGAPAEEPATYEIAISSESEVERWYGVEILSHDKAAVDLLRMKNGAAVLVDHSGDQVGVVEAARLDQDRVLRGKVRFSSSVRGQEVERDVAEKIRRHISVGYFVKKAKLVETRDGGVDVWKITRWQPAEVSIVSVPADTAVGVGRAEGGGSDEHPVELESDGAAVEEERHMLKKKVRDANGAIIEVDESDSRAAVTEAQVVESVTTVEEKRATAIRDICTANQIDQRSAAGFIGSTLSVDEVSARVIEARKTIGTAQPGAESITGHPAKDLRRYSFHRALRQKTDEMEGRGKFDGLEAEVHDEIERNWPAALKRQGGLLAPYSTRTLDSLTLTKGTETVFEQAGELIELLRPKARVIAAGARVLTGLTGPVAFPKQSAGATVYWVPENGATDVGDGDPSLGLALINPKTMQSNIPYTRQLLMQSSLDIEAWLRNELAEAHGLAIDRAAIHGRGNNGEPTGVYAASGVNVKDFSNTKPALATLMEMVSAISDKNADIGTMRWLTTPLMAGSMRTTLEFPGAAMPQGGTLWQGPLAEGTMLGYGAASSTQVSKVMSSSQPTGGTSHGIVFGNWADLMIALFGALEFVIDPFTKKKKGIIEITTVQFADVLIRHGESFSKGIQAPIS